MNELAVSRKGIRPRFKGLRKGKEEIGKGKRDEGGETIGGEGKNRDEK